jgi:biopolymer transport protein ExbD
MFARPRRPKNDDDRILPLINVVFLLMIFFMLAGRLSAADPFKIEPTRSASTGAAEPQEAIILMGADGRLALDGDVIEEDALRASVAKRLADSAATRFRLKADGQAEATKVVGLLELLREAGVEKLRLMTVPGEGQ